MLRDVTTLGKQALGKSILAAAGFELETYVPEVKKAVVIAAPHTSSWDFPLTLAMSYALDLRLRWMGKHTLFAPPFGFVMSALGGMAIDRRVQGGNAEKAVQMFREHDELFLLIAPSGTRNAVSNWKTGFYRIAQAANVPIILGYLDYEKKIGGLARLFEPTGDIERDMRDIQSFYSGMKGKRFRI